MNLVESRHLNFDRHQAPALRVTPGAEVAFKTHDPMDDQARNMAQVQQYWNSGIKNLMLTGPVFIEGAKPGDTLTVDIVKIEFTNPGFQLAGPNRAIVRDELKDWTFYDVTVENNTIKLPCGIELPAKPMVGTLGCASAEGAPTNLAGRLGGNLDVPAVEIDATVHIPVEVEGALFSLGDVHARQGDGEVVGAPEMPSVTTVRFGIIKTSTTTLIIENQGWRHCPCCHEHEGEAARLAVLQNARFISKEYNIELKDALILLTMVGKISISRTGKWGPHLPVVTSSFPKKEIEKALARYDK